jgi:hypothetical protein
MTTEADTRTGSRTEVVFDNDLDTLLEPWHTSSFAIEERIIALERDEVDERGDVIHVNLCKNFMTPRLKGLTVILLWILQLLLSRDAVNIRCYRV